MHLRSMCGALTDLPHKEQVAGPVMWLNLLVCLSVCMSVYISVINMALVERKRLSPNQVKTRSISGMQVVRLLGKHVGAVGKGRPLIQ